VIGGARRQALLGLALVGLAALTGVLLARYAPSVSVLYGLATSRPVLDAGLPIARVLAVGAASLAVAQLLIAVVLVPGEPTGTVTGEGYRALRAAAGWALGATMCSFAVAVLTVAENSGLPLARLLGRPDALVVGLEQVSPAGGWLLTGLVTAAVAGLAGWTLTWRGAAGVLVLALAGLLPAALTQATVAERSHDIAGDALAVHSVASVLWLASALAVAVRGWSGRHADAGALLARRRHTAITNWCLPLVAVSGVIEAAYAVAPGDLVGSGYGRLILLSAVAVLGLAPLARWLRGRPRSSAGLFGVELALLAAAAAAGTALTRLVPPAEAGYQPSRYVYLIGFDLPDHLTTLDLAIRWRPDLVFGPLSILAAAGYLLGVRRIGRRGGRWPARYTSAWLTGCAVLLLSTCSGLGLYAPAVFSVHMVQHMLLATAVPVLLVLGHGVSLALEAAEEPTARRLAALLDAPVVRLVRNPLLAWLAVAATLFGVYATGLYAAILQQHWAHLAMNAASLGTGLALFWPVLGRYGTDGGRGLPAIGQIVLVFAVMGLHAGFSAWLLGRPDALAATFYSALRLPFVASPLADQRLAAELGWALAEAPVVLAVVALMWRWTRDDRVGASAAPWVRSADRVATVPSGEHRS
jgi:putative copper resistance protein D